MVSYLQILSSNTPIWAFINNVMKIWIFSKPPPPSLTLLYSKPCVMCHKKSTPSP